MEQEYFERLTRIEARLEAIQREHPECRKQLADIAQEVAGMSASLQLAHKRIDDFKRDVCWAIGMSTTIVGVFSTFLTWLLGGRGMYE